MTKKYRVDLLDRRTRRQFDHIHVIYHINDRERVVTIVEIRRRPKDTYR